MFIATWSFYEQQQNLSSALVVFNVGIMIDKYYEINDCKIEHPVTPIYIITLSKSAGRDCSLVAEWKVHQEGFFRHAGNNIMCLIPEGY